MDTATMSAKGWIVIPKEIRERYGLGKGSKLRVRESEGVIVVEPIPDARALFGILREGPSLIEGIAEEHAAEVALEERKFVGLKRG